MSAYSIIRLRPTMARDSDSLERASLSRPSGSSLRAEPLAHLLAGDISPGQDRADQLPLEPLTIGHQSRQPGGAGRFEHDAEFPVCLLHRPYQRVVFD